MFTDMRQLEIRNGSLELTYHDTGTGLPVVLLHGFPFTSEMWRPQIDAIGAEHRVIAPDLRGFGGSGTTPGPYTMDLFADDTAELLDALELDDIVLGGLSMGGYIAFEFCRRHGERLRGLVLADTRAEPDTPEARENRKSMAELASNEGTSAVVERMLPKLLAPDTPQNRSDVVERLRVMMESVETDTVVAALEGMSVRADSRPMLPKLDLPVLVLNGAQDTITTSSGALAMAGQIPGARVAIIDDAGHVSNLEQPDAFNAAVLSFLDTLK